MWGTPDEKKDKLGHVVLITSSKCKSDFQFFSNQALNVPRYTWNRCQSPGNLLDQITLVVRESSSKIWVRLMYDQVPYWKLRPQVQFLHARKLRKDLRLTTVIVGLLSVSPDCLRASFPLPNSWDQQEIIILAT